MEIIKKIYETTKGKFNQSALFAVLTRDFLDNEKLSERDVCLLKLNSELFPAVIRKINRKDLGITIPYRFKKNIENSVIQFISKSISLKDLENSNLSQFLQEKTIRDFPIYFFQNQQKVLAWIFSKGNRYHELPLNLELNKNEFSLLEFSGAYFCEGFKARKKGKHRDRFSFSNADSEQIKWFIDCVEKLFKINKGKWKAQILHNKGNEKSLLYFWKGIGLNKHKISFVKNATVKSKDGVCILNIFNSTLAEIVSQINKRCEELALSSKENAINFFRGLSRGDIGIGNIKSRQVNFTTESEENAIFFRKLCEKIGIPSSKIFTDKRSKKTFYVFIYGYKNFLKIKKLGLINHFKRNYNLKYKLLKSKNSSFVKYLKAIYKGNNTAKSSAEFLKLSVITTRAYLSILESKSLLKSVVINKFWEKQYKLTKKGKEELNFYIGLDI